MAPKKFGWKGVAFLLISKLTSKSQPHFSRSDLMKPERLDLAVKFLDIFGHKKNPTNSEETLQKTIQNLRDEGHIDFLGNGEYKLSKSGFEKIDEAQSLMQEFLAKNDKTKN